MPDFLEITNASIGYQKPLISNVNATLNCGSVTLLIGNNGTGKTSLIKSLINQIPVLNGTVNLDGKSISKLEEKGIAKKIGVVFSKALIPPHYTTRDLISLGKFIHLPYYYELSEQDKKEIETIIIQLKLEEFADLPLNKLSDGNLQKAFIGRAVAQNATLIILDEPTTHLDEYNKIIILKLLRDLAKNHNKSILFSSHDWRLAKEFADYIWYIHDGKFQQGLAEDILLNNEMLTHPQLFILNENFVSPEISAPFLEKEMLYSALQKNFRKDLSNYSITFENGMWIIRYGESTISCSSVEKIIESIKKSF